jgi:hypothetical protein
MSAMKAARVAAISASLHRAQMACHDLGLLVVEVREVGGDEAGQVPVQRQAGGGIGAGEGGVEALGDVGQEVVEVAVLLLGHDRLRRAVAVEDAEDVVVLVAGVALEQREQRPPPGLEDGDVVRVGPVGGAGEDGDVEEPLAEGLVDGGEEVVSVHGAMMRRDRRRRHP